MSTSVGRYGLLVVLVVLIPAGVALAHLIGGPLLAGLVVLALALLLVVSRFAWLPKGHGYIRIRLASLFVILTVAGWYILPVSLLEIGATSLLQLVGTALPLDWGVRLADSIVVPIAPPWWALPLILMSVIAINYTLPDRSSLPPNSSPAPSELKTKGYADLRADYCNSIVRELDGLDHRSNWSDRRFIPLDADVEIQTGAGPKRRICSFVDALSRAEPGRPVLVLGEPGSGKSVALRRLTRRLASEAGKTERIPLYINLKDWTPTRDWSEAAPPTLAELEDFILKNLKDRGDIDANDFLDCYYEQVRRANRFFFVFDSFDEMPSVLASGERGRAIDALSDVLSKFFPLGTMGLVASRFFRQPTKTFQTSVTFFVRPLDDLKIQRLLMHHGRITKSRALALYRERPHRMSAARNPLVAALIGSFLSKTQGAVPETEATLYKEYIEGRLERSQERMKKYGLTTGEVIQYCATLASEISTSNVSGLEISLERFAAAGNSHGIFDVLQFARLARVSLSSPPTFSFAHRRFFEVFYVLWLEEHPRALDLSAIPKDGAQRDALVLYCEVASAEKARLIGEFCWGKIKEGQEENMTALNRDAIHCLRFIAEAFRTRRELLSVYHEEMATRIGAALRESPDLFTRMYMAEATGVLPDNMIGRVVPESLRSDNRLIRESAIRACRHLTEISGFLEDGVMEYIDGLDDHQFLSGRRDIVFSLSISEAFSSLKVYALARYTDSILQPVLKSLVAIVAPPIALGIWFSHAVVDAAFPAEGTHQKRRNASEHRWLRKFMASWAGLIIGLTLQTEFLLQPQSTLRERWTAFPVRLESGEYLHASERFSSDAIWGLLTALSRLSPWSYLWHVESIGLVVLVGVVMWNMRIASAMFRLWRVSTKKAVLNAFLILLLAFVLAGIMFYGAIQIVSMLAGYATVLGGLTLAVMLAFGAAVLWRGGRAMVRALRELRRDKNEIEAFPWEAEESSREVIGRTFRNLRTAGGRAKFVSRLEAERGLKVKGEWQGGFFPWTRNDDANDRLAILDERWRGEGRVPRGLAPEEGAQVPSAALNPAVTPLVVGGHPTSIAG